MKRFIYIFIISLLLCSACNPKISTSIHNSYSPIDYNQEVLVLNIDQLPPENSEILGTVKIGDTGFTTNCQYETVINKAKEEARKVGGNVIHILSHQLPNIFGSSCHRITANILKTDNIDSITFQVEDIIDSIDYAILNLYRLPGPGALVNYNVHLGDSSIFRAKNKSKISIKTTKDGMNSVWAKTEAKVEIPIDIKIGKTYYIKCGINYGLLVGRPSLELVNPAYGKAEFDAIKSQK